MRVEQSITITTIFRNCVVFDLANYMPYSAWYCQWLQLNSVGKFKNKLSNLQSTQR